VRPVPAPGFPLIDFDQLHGESLPAWLGNGRGELARRAVAAVAGLRPIAFRLPDGRAYTYSPGGSGVEVAPGEEGAATVVEMSAETWSDYAHELHTAFGLLYGGQVGAARGGLEQLVMWEPVVRAMLSGRPVYRVEDVDLTAADGTPLDLEAGFTLDSPPDEVRRFFRATGFVHIRGVFSPDEMAGVVSEVERLAAMARPGDDRSWWAKNADGREVLCRLIYINERSELLARAHEDGRLQKLIGAVRPDGADLIVGDVRGDGHSVVLKNPGAVEGLSDLPWHVDCGLGGHPILCPAINLGVQLDAATPEAGQLHFLAGSAGRSATHLTPEHLRDGDYPAVAVTTEPGDVTMHLGDTLHLAPPPTAGPAGPVRGRRAMYLTWHNRLCADHIPPGSGYNDVVLHSGRENVVSSVPEQLAGR
jgi:hypothetical protein